MRSLIVSSSACFVAVAVLAGAQAPSSEPVDGLPEAPGKATLLRLCTDCHGTGLITEFPQDAAEWRASLELMEAFGAYGTPDEWMEIEDYLLAQLAIVRVNEADSEELQAFFDVPEPVAQAMIAAREARRFETVEDLTTIEGVDAARVDARKDRVVFQR